jgi:hypothetical protein
MYGGATMIAASRMYNNKHWASDVVMGAAIGTFAGTKVVRYHHSHPGNRIDKWLLNRTSKRHRRVAVGMSIQTGSAVVPSDEVGCPHSGRMRDLA